MPSSAGAGESGGSGEGGCWCAAVGGFVGGLWLSGPPTEAVDHWDQENMGGEVSDRALFFLLLMAYSGSSAF